MPVYGVITGNYSYSYRAPRYEKDGWGVNLTGLNLSSMDAFGKSFMNAAKSSIAGYLAAKTAQKLGAGDFASSLIGSLASARVSETTEGLISQGHISEVDNDRELEIELVGFNKEQFNAEITQIKQTIFNEAVDDGVPQAVAEQIAEDEVKEIEQDLATFKKKVKEVRESIEKEGKREAKEKYAAEENIRSSADDIAMDWLLNPPTNEALTSGAHMSELFREVIQGKSNLTPREEMLAYVPKNEKERELKRITLLRYDAEDFIEKHPMAESLFIGAMYGLQGVEYAGAAATGGLLAVAGKYVSQEAISHAIDTTIEESTSKAVEGMVVSPALREEFQTTLKVTAYVGLSFGSIKAAKKLSGTLAKSAKKGVLQKNFTKAEMTEILAGKSIQKASEIPLLEAPKMVKHHIFNVFRGNSAKSQKYRDFFKKHNIDLDSYCVEISQHRHVSEIHALKNNWTTQWKRWIDAHPDATTREVYQQAGAMMDKYGLSSIPLTKYRSSKK